MFNGRKTQTNLVLKGYNPGNIDSVIGKTTLTALVVYASGRKATAVPLAADLGEAMAKYLDQYAVNTPLRLAHFLAQASCETALFSTLKEFGGPAYFAKYDGRKDLGNTQTGDGARFCGRGLLQTTGRANYTALAAVTGIDCVNHPELLEQPDTAVKSAVIYWKSRNVNVAADADDITKVTKLINGGLNALKDRQSALDRLKLVIQN